MPNLEYALSTQDKDSAELLHVSTVSRGKKCKCYCPECLQPLQAKQGEVKEWHFAHINTGETKAGCGVESAMHLAAKKWLQENKRITISGIPIIGRVEMQFMKAIPEKRLPFGIQPDITLVDFNGFCFVEICVTNAKTKEHIQSYRDHNCFAVEYKFDKDSSPTDEYIESVFIRGGSVLSYPHSGKLYSQKASVRKMVRDNKEEVQKMTGEMGSMKNKVLQYERAYKGQEREVKRLKIYSDSLTEMMSIAQLKDKDEMEAWKEQQRKEVLEIKARIQAKHDAIEQERQQYIKELNKMQLLVCGGDEALNAFIQTLDKEKQYTTTQIAKRLNEQLLPRSLITDAINKKLIVRYSGENKYATYVVNKFDIS